ncbi:MAG TPA: hypothetical protein VKR32_10415 [Puia sp.]|nr:hypothetical protein [Puia sp.]
MDHPDYFQTTPRRGFIGTVAGSAAALGLGGLFSPFGAIAGENSKQLAEDADAWFAKVKGKHRIVFDCTEPAGVFPLAWPKIFVLTNGATGSTPKDCGVVVIFRHNAIPFALQDSLWSKYKFSDMFKIGSFGPAFQAADAATALTTRNPFWNTKPGDFVFPGFGPVPLGFKDLMDDGVMFCACDAALTVYSSIVAMETKGDAAEIKKEWIAGLIPGVQVVPSGVWAVGRAQEHQCAYCYVHAG